LEPPAPDSTTTDALTDAEYEAARRRVLAPWAAEIRERLRLAEIALVPPESRKVHWPGPGPGPSPLPHINRPSVSRATARRHSAQERHANKADKAAKHVLEMPLNAPPVRHDRSIVKQLANQIRANMNRENPKC
jgi:hypothetical protein